MAINDQKETRIGKTKIEKGEIEKNRVKWLIEKEAKEEKRETKEVKDED
jgi:hypothetical protein